MQMLTETSHKWYTSTMSIEATDKRGRRQKSLRCVSKTNFTCYAEIRKSQNQWTGPNGSLGDLQACIDLKEISRAVLGYEASFAKGMILRDTESCQIELENDRDLTATSSHTLSHKFKSSSRLY